MREERVSARRNPLAKLLLPIRPQLEVQPKHNDIERGHSQLPQITSRMENETRQGKGHISNLELRIEHLEKSIGMLERLRRHKERFLASKVSQKGGWPEVGAKLEHGEQLKVVFINDMGLLYGAGVGLRRQVESFLKAGHKVAASLGCQRIWNIPISITTHTTLIIGGACVCYQKSLNWLVSHVSL